MLKKFYKYSMSLAAAFTLLACSTQTPSKEKVSESVKKILPVNFEVVSVTPFKPVPGLVQVVLSMNNQPVVFYMDAKGKYIVSGSVVELETKKNLTAETLASFSGLQKKSAAIPAVPAPQAK